MPILAEPKSSYNATHQQQWIEVLVDCPGVQGLFTYRIPSDLVVQPGDILSISFGHQLIGGIAIRYINNPPADLDLSQIKEVEDVITSGFFPPHYWSLLNQVAQYYCTNLITVIRMALPPSLLGRSQRRIRLKPEVLPQGAEFFCSIPAQQILRLLQKQKEGDYSIQYIKREVRRGTEQGIRELTKKGWIESYLEHPRNTQIKLQQAVILVETSLPLNLTKSQREILDILRHQGGELWLSDLQSKYHINRSTVKTLAKNGYVVIEEREKLRFLQHPETKRDQAKALTTSQQEALEIINNLTGFAQILLHGVTGSGKTEVYLQAIAAILAQEKSALVLVPEIGLTPQLTDRFRARFGDHVYVYHSALSEGERYDTWRQMLTGRPQVVIGTRSALFAPLPNLGLIVLDEEHDSSFKQVAPIPTYHARTVAKWRAELANCPLILGSATPSVESWVNIRQESGINSPGSDVGGGIPRPSRSQKLAYYLSLPARIQSRPLPPVEIVDMRQELKQGNRSIFSNYLQQSLENLLKEQKQGILFISRRGHSTFVSCRNCGYVVGCPHCDVSLSYHYTHEGATQLLRCHYCNYSQLHPRTCPECSSPYLKFFGSGTQKVTQELTKNFPDLRWIRFDSDTTRTKGAHRHLLSQFARGEADVLVGTQMLTKGLDLEQVTLVGVVAADGLLYHCDYRASERAFQTLTQVAGRAGRGNEPGQVIIQTYSPEHPVIKAVKDHDYDQFIERELPERESLNYPPYGRLILIRLSGTDAIEVQQAAENVADVCLEKVGSVCEILGPAPATIIRVANRYRWHILLKFSAEIQDILADLTSLRSFCPHSVRVTIDVDPLSLD
jgi:primosomal protein N' (replication factor Y)